MSAEPGSDTGAVAASALDATLQAEARTIATKLAENRAARPTGPDGGSATSGVDLDLPEDFLAVVVVVPGDGDA